LGNADIRANNHEFTVWCHAVAQSLQETDGFTYEKVLQDVAGVSMRHVMPRQRAA
jgi:hypothetical protein